MRFFPRAVSLALALLGLLTVGPVPAEAQPTGTATETPQAKSESEPPKQGQPPKLGRLTELSGKRYRSTAGLIYTPGSREGHRLQHVMRHAKDDANRPIHGVFDGGYGEILGVIDEAYLTALVGKDGVTTERDGPRTVYTVNLKRRIGFIGGQAGRRRKNPPVTHLRLVLEQNRVITCFPLEP